MPYHILVCYVGKEHFSSDIHQSQEASFQEDKEAKSKSLNELKKITFQIREALLTNQLEIFGRLLNDAWELKKSFSNKISNQIVDELYKIGLNNGAYGGKLLGAGNGGYIMFFHSPKRRKELIKALEEKSGEILDFSFESSGTQIWKTKNRF